MELTGTGQLLEQTIRSNDWSLVNYILNKIPPEEIPDLIAAMPTTSIGPFFMTFTKHVVSNPDSLSLLLPWFEAVISMRKVEISASVRYRSLVRELQRVLKVRTEHLGYLHEVCAMSRHVEEEKEGGGLGLEIIDAECQDLSD